MKIIILLLNHDTWLGFCCLAVVQGSLVGKGLGLQHKSGGVLTLSAVDHVLVIPHSFVDLHCIN